MDRKRFEEMLMDRTLSDKVVFRALLEHLKTAKEFDQQTDESLVKLIAERRPEVWKKFTEYVTAGHEYCCGPKAIQDDDGLIVKARKTIFMWFGRLGFYFKFGE